MPMPADELRARIVAAFPDADVDLRDLAGDNDHWSARITSEAFRGLSRVRQHQLVYAAIGTDMGGRLHALQLTTLAPARQTGGSDDHSG
jgi:stress-induced morphogen